MNFSHSKFYTVKIIVMIFIIFATTNSAQLDLTRFYDSAHHWYDIKDENRAIDPLPNQLKYRSTEFEYIADNILLFQKDNGGWTKNYDMQAMLSSEQIEKIIADKSNLNTTFDNGATHTQISYLAEAYTILKSEKYKIAFLKGLDFVLEAQYDNGGWPQYYPDTSGYRKYITYNDGAMMGVMELLYHIIYKDPNYMFVSEDYYQKVQSVFEKGIDCILKTQIVENNGKNVWCQQHDNTTLKPQNARTFEPAAICNGESSEIVLFLMKLDKPDDRIKSAIKSSVKWFEDAGIEGIRVEIVEAPKEEFLYHSTNFDRQIVEDKNAPKIWTRFNELETHVPMFCRRDKTIVYSLAEVERERRTGYSWYTYSPQEVLDFYPKWLAKWGKN
jgi:PelA/Pel-15E family pectate lyase